MAVDVENGKVIKVTGNECPKGEKYAMSEVENPARILTSVILGQGLELKMIPVRTDKPMPKSRIFEAMNEIKKIKVQKPLSAGDVIIKNFLGLDVNLISTRKAEWTRNFQQEP